MVMDVIRPVNGRPDHDNHVQASQQIQIGTQLLLLRKHGMVHHEHHLVPRPIIQLQVRQSVSISVVQDTHGMAHPVCLHLPVEMER